MSEPLTAEEEALYREGLRNAPTVTDGVPWSLLQITTAEWADRCRRLLATLDAARSRPPDCGDHYIAGYQAALAARTCMECEQPWKRGHECLRQPEYARLADGLGADIDITCSDIEGRWIEDHLATLDKP